MKNNFIIFFFILLFLCKNSFADQFIFETSKIEVAEGGKYIYATDGKATSTDKNLIIEANNFEYSDELQKLKAYEGSAIIKSDNLEIEFKEIDFDQVNSIITTENEVKIYDNKKDFFIKTENIIYDYKIGIIKSSTKSFLKINLKMN